LCGDAIVNYRTVQSFGNTELLCQKYEEFLKPSYEKAKKTHIMIGFAFGLSQLAQYFVFAAMFFAAGKFIKADPENIKVEDVMIALFAIMFGASTAGSASAFGPDMGKASAAAKRIFSIVEHDSSINAMQIDDDANKIRLQPANVQGKIEFKDVWFRYPTRKQDFVLKGLNLTILPGQSVALVGESGCGKSTFVNLLMRFYDVDHGEVLLDG
jgi:ATP-binding cassette subfamily B (MDR/TAP) protein 1